VAPVSAHISRACSSIEAKVHQALAITYGLSPNGHLVVDVVMLYNNWNRVGNFLGKHYRIWNSMNHQMRWRRHRYWIWLWRRRHSIGNSSYLRGIPDINRKWNVVNVRWLRNCYWIKYFLNFSWFLDGVGDWIGDMFNLWRRWNGHWDGNRNIVNLWRRLHWDSHLLDLRWRRYSHWNHYRLNRWWTWYWNGIWYMLHFRWEWNWYRKRDSLNFMLG